MQISETKQIFIMMSRRNRQGGKKPLGRIDEEDTEVNNMRGRRGKADGTDYNTRRSSVDVDNNTTSSTMNSTSGHGRKHKENQTFGQRLRSLFGGSGSGGGNKKKQNSSVSTSTNTMNSSTNLDPLRSRYKEYRGEEYDDRKRKETSTPESKTSWFRSLDRQPKHRNHHEKSWNDTTDSRYGGSTRTLRYFGESDTEAMRKPPTKFTSGTLRRNHRFLLDSTSQDDTTDVDTNGRSDSVLYLHTATVGRIPSGNSERSSRFRSESRSEEHEQHRRKRTGRTVVRSVSVASPWRPSDPNNRVIHYSSTDRLSNKSHNTHSGHRDRGTEKYGHLVFTGPSFDEQLKTDAYRNDRRRF